MKFHNTSSKLVGKLSGKKMGLNYCFMIHITRMFKIL